MDRFVTISTSENAEISLGLCCENPWRCCYLPSFATITKTLLPAVKCGPGRVMAGILQDGFKIAYYTTLHGKRLVAQET